MTGFHTATYPAGATFGPRRLGNHELVWLLEGAAVYTHNGVAHDAPAGSLVLCRPPAVDAFRWDPARRTHHAYFHFDLRGALPAAWPAPADWPVVRTPPGGGGDELLPALFRNLLAWGGDAGDAQTRWTALALLAAFVTGRTSPRAGTVAGTGDAPLPEPVRVALTHLERRLDADARAPLTLADLSRAASVTPEHLCRLFKQATGRTPLETVRRRRLERARTLLSRTNYTVAEVADLCGFASPFHFSRRFKETFGVPPSALRGGDL